MHLFELSEAARFLRPWFARECAWPQGPGDLADIEVAVRIRAHAVRTDEACWPEARMGIANPTQQLALVVDDATARPEVRALEVDCHGRTELADIANRVAGIVHVKPAWAVQIVPLRLVFAVAVGNLDAAVV